MKKTIACAYCAVGMLAMAGAETLWPGPDTVMRAQSDSSITTLADGSVGVTTGVKASWPGVRMDFVKGEADLSRFGRFVVTVSNTTHETRTVCLSVKGRGVQGQGPGGSVILKPHTTGEIVASVRGLPWTLDEPLKLEGMNGRPAALDDAGGGFNIRHTTSFHIFFCQDGVASGFSVLRVTADGVGVPAPKVLPAKTFLPFVDRFGQFMHDDWQGKVHDEAELARTKADEDAWLAKNGATPIPESDRFGGWAGGPQLKATGFFRTEKVNGKWWLVDPEGRLFFSHGVDCVGIGNGTTGIGFREKYFSWTPAKDDPDFGGFWGKCTWPAAHNFYKDPAHLPYDTFSFANANLRRKYGAGWKAEYIDRAHRRLRAWGLNTIANWSWSEIYSLDRTPYTLCLGTHGTPRLKDSKGWWGALPDPFNPEFEKKFRERARNAAKTMRDDPWCVGVFVDNELSWNGEERMKDVAEQYFSTIRRVLKEELPNHLYLGCRIAWGTDVIYRAAARHCDVVSVNIYNRRPTKDLPSDAEDKPMINGEFHFGALDRGMFHTGLVATRDQDERAQCYRDFVNACLDHPRFVGTHWFQWQDQALTGRSDGENYQIGFLNVADVPYPELVQAARDIGATMYRRRWGKDGKKKAKKDKQAKVDPRASLPAGAILCEGEYDGHLQGTATDGKFIYWPFTKSIVKTDLKGHVVASTRQPSHQGDCCVVDGTLYIAVNLGKFNTETGGVSWVWAYDTRDLSLKKEYPVPELVHGSGGITFHDGRFYVVGGLPPTHVRNYVYEYTPDFTFVKRHVLETGYTVLGIQAAAFVRGQFLFGCYSNKEYPTHTLACPTDLGSFKRLSMHTDVGMVDLDGNIFTARTRRLPSGRWCGFLIPDEIK